MPTPTMASSAEAAADSTISEQVSLSVIPGTLSEDSTMKLQVSVQTPEKGQRQPSDIVCVLDISGSMGLEAQIMGASGTAESHGLSLLDVAKHGVRTIVHALGPQDRMAVVAFNHNASTVFPLTVMDEAGQATAENLLDELMQGGGTNIWAGLESGLNALRADMKPGRFGHVMLLTDGESNGRDSIIPNMKHYEEKHEGLPGTVNTFGFGYNLDSKLLVDMAAAGSGAYSFIPDAGFVGTAFVNMMCQLLVTMARDVYLHLEKPESGAEILAPYVQSGWPVQEKDGFYRISLGTLQYGQNKDVVVPLKVTDTDAEIGVSGRYFASSGAGVELAFVSALVSSKPSPEAALGVEEQWCRCHFVEAITKAQATAEKTRSDESTEEGLKLMQNAVTAIKASPAKETKPVEALLEDAEGQSTEALSRQDWYWRWGRHYLPSVMFAHKLQICNNFKDPGVQGYGGELFRSLRDEADEIFCKLPAPKPSTRRASTSTAAAAPVSMAAYHDPGCVCVDGSSPVELEGGVRRRVAELAKGDRVVAADGATAEVLCMVRTRCPGGRAALVELPGGLRLTAYHPVQLRGAWRFPVDEAKVEELPCEEVYSFVLDGAPAMCVGGIPCAALGHGIEEGAAKHPYFGTRRVLEDLASFPGFASGLVELSMGAAQRDPATSLVCCLLGARQ